MKLPFATNEGCGKRARFGLIVLQTDETLEYEVPRMLGDDGVILHISRVPSGLDVTPASLAAMATHIPQSARLLPAAEPFSAVAYCCTSGATVIGEDRVQTLIQDILGPVPVTNPMTAVKSACRELGVERLGFVTPYVAEVSAAMRQSLEAAGIKIAGFGSFEEGQESTVARIDEASVLAAIERVAELQPCDAVFSSCTNLRGLGIIAEAERRIGKPVITSNQALAWHLSQLAGLQARSTDAFGHLFEVAR